MRSSYVNKQGDRITVTEEHLMTAVKIKQELQKSSPSRRCSWSLLVKMMEKEGFYDADNNENYRQMIKQYQKSIGELPEGKKHADMVSEGKLESIKELVGEIAYEKRENQHVLKELNKVKREVIDYSLIAEQIGCAIKNHDFSELKIDIENNTEEGKNYSSKSGKRMIVTLTDLHIGALVDTDSNTYNYKIAIDRMTRFANIITSEAKYNGINKIDVVNCGDVIEHSNMRYGQGYDCEFVFSEQQVKASDLIIKFLISLSKEGFKVSYAGFAGNHDRMTDKDKNISGDHAVRLINGTIKVFIENAELETKIEYVQAKDYEHSLLNINGANFKFVHGDLDSFKDENIVAKYSNIDGVDYDAVVMGHFHHFRVIETNKGKQIILFGSLKGSDDYSEVKLKKYSQASQGIIIVDEDGDFEAKRVKLQ